MTSSSKKPGVAFWATVLVVVGLVAYPLSFGPACWISSQAEVATERLILMAYRPLTQAATTLGLGWAVHRYAEAGASQGWHLGEPRESKGLYFPPRL
jgi:hypothetical protein